MYTLVPVMELEWFGAQSIGRVHGTTMLGAIIGQAALYNVVGNMVAFRTALAVNTGVSLAHCPRLRPAPRLIAAGRIFAGLYPQLVDGLRPASNPRQRQLAEGPGR